MQRNRGETLAEFVCLARRQAWGGSLSFDHERAVSGFDCDLVTDPFGTQ